MDENKETIVEETENIAEEAQQPENACPQDEPADENVSEESVSEPAESEEAELSEETEETNAAEEGESAEGPADEAMEEDAGEPAEEQPGEETAAQPEAEQPVEAPKPQPIPILTEEKNPELAPVSVPNFTMKKYSQSLERERIIAAEVRKRRRRPVIAVLILSVLVIIAALIADAVQNKNKTKTSFEEVGIHAVEIVTADPNAPAVVTEKPVVTEPPEEKTSTYELIIKDVSWVIAAEECRQMGGHLVAIETEEEFNKVITLAEAYNMNNVWIGCHRVDNTLVWEAEGADEQFYHVWDDGEPSYYDTGDWAEENFVMLWNHNGRWCYNDSRNDPAGEFPNGYSGKICYICEFEP